MRRPAALVVVASVLGLAALAPTAARAQENCEFLPGTGNVRGVTIGASRITYLKAPNLACEGGVHIRADSAVVFEATAFTQLFGHVRYEDPSRRMRAQQAQYFSRVGRLQAQGDVEVVRTTDGSVIRGQDLVYLRASPEREERLSVSGDPASATLVVAADSGATPTTQTAGGAAAEAPTADSAIQVAAGAPTVANAADDTTRSTPPSGGAVTYDVLAERIVFEGQRGFVAVGDGRPVEIVRDSLRAFGDSVAYDEVGGLLALREDARLRGAGYDLTGESIDVLLPGQVVREVVARGGALLEGADVKLRAPRIRMFLMDGAVQRLVAMPSPDSVLDAVVADDAAATRAHATAETFEMTADSIDVVAPGEVLERIVAVGEAMSISSARDSLNTPATPPVARRDWIAGDTIVALFDRTAAADTSAYRLERLEARGSARSLYRMAPSDSAGAVATSRLAVHYVTGEVIVIELEAGQIERMEVAGTARGLHLEPLAPAAPDTATAPRQAPPPSATPPPSPRLRPPALSPLAGTR